MMSVRGEQEQVEGVDLEEKKEKKKANSTVHFYSEPRIENTVDQYHVFI